MSERMTCLSVATLFGGNHNHADIPRFLGEFGRAIYAGEGKKPRFLTALDISTDLPLRLMVGVPAKTLSRPQRLLAEAAVCMVLDRDLGDVRKLWSSGTGWRPANPARVPAPIKSSCLDHDWMMTLGISRTVWERDVLFAPMRVTDTGNREATVVRQLLALAAYGFADPYPFFTLDQHAASSD